MLHFKIFFSAIHHVTEQYVRLLKVQCDKPTQMLGNQLTADASQDTTAKAIISNIGYD